MLANIVRVSAGRQLSRLTQRQVQITRRLATLRRSVKRDHSTYLRSLAAARRSFEASLGAPSAMRARQFQLSKRLSGGAAAAAAPEAAGAKEAPKASGGGGGGGGAFGKLLLLGLMGIGVYYGYQKFGAGGGASGMPELKSKNSLCAKYLTPELYEKYKGHKTQTSGFTIDQAIACAVAFDNQNVGVYAGDFDTYRDFSELFDPIIRDYHNFSGKHKSDLDVGHIAGNIARGVPVKSTRIRVGRNIKGLGLSPGITRAQRQEVERLMKQVFGSLDGDLAGTYYPLQGMDAATKQQLIDDHFLFISGDPNLVACGMEREWPEGRGIFHNKDKTFLVWVNEEDQLRIISMQKGGDVKQVFERLARGIAAIEKILKQNSREFAFDEKLGYIHTCPTNLGTGMRASVHIDLGNLQKKLGGHHAMKEHCEAMHLQARGTRGESSGETGTVYDISNLHRLGYTEVELVQTMIDGVNKLYKQDKDAK